MLKKSAVILVVGSHHPDSFRCQINGLKNREYVQEVERERYRRW